MMSHMLKNKSFPLLTLAIAAASAGLWTTIKFGHSSAIAAPAPAAEATIDQPKVPLGEWPMWGLTPHRNMVSPEKNPPTDWDVTTGKNILWSQTLGSLSNGNPMVGQGIVTVGTNNEGARDQANTADGGVIMAL